MKERDLPVKILVVDDDRLILTTLTQGLRTLGYRVWGAASGGEALKLAEEVHPDLVLLDIRLPDVSGPEIARTLDEELGIPVLFLSAYDDRDAVTAAAQAGGVGYLTKPCSIQHLAPALEVGLERARERKALKERNARLQAALNRTREINVAVGILMERFRLPRREAYECLRRQARRQRRKVLELAGQVVAMSELVNDLVREHLLNRLNPPA